MSTNPVTEETTRHLLGALQRVIEALIIDDKCELIHVRKK